MSRAFEQRVQIARLRDAVIVAAKAWVDVDYGEPGDLEAGVDLCEAVQALCKLEVT